METQSVSDLHLLSNNLTPLLVNGNSGLISDLASNETPPSCGMNGASLNGSSAPANANNSTLIYSTRSSNQFVSCKTEWVRLNIGGQCFVTTKTTLCKNPQSFFYKLLQDDPSISLTTDRVGVLYKRIDFELNLTEELTRIFFCNLIFAI